MSCAVVSYHTSLSSPPWQRLGYSSSSCSSDSSHVSCRQSNGTSPPSPKSRVNWSQKTRPADVGGLVVRNTSSGARARAARRPLQQGEGRRAVLLARDNRSVDSRIPWRFLITSFIRGILISRRRATMTGILRLIRLLLEAWAPPRQLIKTGRPQFVDVSRDLRQPTTQKHRLWYMRL